MTIIIVIIIFNSIITLTVLVQAQDSDTESDTVSEFSEDSRAYSAPASSKPKQPSTSNAAAVSFLLYCSILFINMSICCSRNVTVWRLLKLVGAELQIEFPWLLYRVCALP